MNVKREKANPENRPRRVPRTVQMAQRFWQQAQPDLANASMMLRPGAYYVAANLAYQATEKALKAACWHLRGEEPPWTHEITGVAALITERVSEIPDAVRAGVSYLAPVFVRSRYASSDVEEAIPAALIREHDAQECVRSAQEIMAWVETLLQQPSFRAMVEKLPILSGEAATREDLVVNFARLLRQRYGARLFLFGSRARGTTHKDSDYDFVAVAKAFGEQPLLHRAPDRWDIWLQAGGWRIPLDLHCYTPEEFRRELAGLGFIGMAKRRGELIEIKVPVFAASRETAIRLTRTSSICA